jgi:MFS family permease
MGMQPDGGVVAKTTEPVVLEGVTVTEAFGTAAFWLIAVMMLLSGLVAMGIGVNLMPYLTDKNVGHSPTTAALIISIISFMTVTGKIGIGFIADRWGIQRAVALAFSILVAGIFLSMGARSFPIACTFAVVYGFAIGTPLLINPALTADCLGLKNFGSIFGILTLINVVGVAVGAYTTGVIYVKAGESYLPAFWLFIVLMTIAGFCGVMARKERPEELEH